MSDVVEVDLLKAACVLTLEELYELTSLLIKIRESEVEG